MTDDLVKRLRSPANVFYEYAADDGAFLHEAASRIEKLESVTKDDAKWLATYHKWCEMNGCAPSSSDLIAARKTLEGKNESN
jgi:hypothetical protein